MASTLPIRTFDRQDDFTIVERNRLSHWLQAGTISFITWRTWDSMPKTVLARWHQERSDLLKAHGIAPDADWKKAARDLPVPIRLQIHNLLSARWEAHLNECHGECVLRRPEIAQ